MNDNTNNNTNNETAYTVKGYDNTAINALKTLRRNCKYLEETAEKRGIPTKDYEAALDFFDKWSAAPPDSPEPAVYILELCICAYHAGAENGRAEHGKSGIDKGAARQ